MPEREIILDSDINQLERLTAFLEESASEWGIDDNTLFYLNLVAEEIISNIILYGYKDAKSDETIQFRLTYARGELEMYIKDQSPEFNLLKVPPPNDLSKPVSERKIGGLGIHFIKKMMDRIEYQRKDNSNILILYKKIS